MTYYVLDATQVPQCEDRVAAERLKADLERDNPDAQWQVATSVQFNEDSPFEQLYTLAANLLETTGANPFTLGLEIANLDGTLTFVSARDIMNTSRRWLDASELAS